MVQVRDLLLNLGSTATASLRPEDLALPVTRVTADSREVVPGTVFVAIRGQSQDGHQFIPAAQQAGAVAIVGEIPSPAGVLAPYLQVDDARLALAKLAAGFFGHPSREMKVIGVTGTSGKTTTTYLIESILKAAGHSVGVIGTVNFRYAGKVEDSTHTTPGPVELQGLLARMREAGCTAVVMEVSSHALKQRRVAELAFDGMVFTNLTPEHLDFHPDMEDYFRSKASLFTEGVETAIRAGKKPFAAVNADDSYGRRLVSELQSKPIQGFRVETYGVMAEATIHGSRLEATLAGIEGEVAGIRVRSPLIGAFNASNILSAVTVARGLGIPSSAIEAGIRSLISVPGRLERVSDPNGRIVLVDYAHKPDALAKVLRTLRAMRDGKRLITVFGCGGDRDRKKRPVMGRLAAELSDRAVVTSDNPRTEAPDAIIREIRAGMGGFSNYTVEPDRKKAIFEAIRMAKPGDIVLIAGKGHEDYQILGKRKVRFDDREVAAEALSTSSPES